MRKKNAAETSGTSPPEHSAAYFRLKKFLARHPGYMAGKLRELRKRRPNYYSAQSVAQRLRRRTEAAKAARA